MKIIKKELRVKNAVGLILPATEPSDFEKIVDESTRFRNFLIEQEYYTLSPIIFSWNPFEPNRQVRLLTSVGNDIDFLEAIQEPFFYEEQLNMATDFYYRHYDQEEEIPYTVLKNKVEEQGLEVESFYHVLLNLAGDIVVDLYCEVRNGGS